MNDTLTWSFNTITQKQFKYNPIAEIVHKGTLEEVLDKLLPSMGRTDIPSHIVNIINFHGPGVLELPGTQRWDGLRLYYRNDNVNLILDYDAYKSDLSVTNMKFDGTISIESMSELKLPPKWKEEMQMKDDTLKTGFSEVNEMLELNGGIQAGELTRIPNRWLGESEINPEAVEYANLANEQTLTDATGTKGVVVVVEEDDPVDPFDQTGPRDEESIKREIELRRNLDIARGRNNVRIGALGEPVGSIEEVKKAKDALKEFLADKDIKLVVPDSQRLGRMRTINPADIELAVDCEKRGGDLLNFKILKGRGANSDFDGDQIQVPSGMERLRRMQWRTRNPDIATFIKEGRELYEGDFKPISVLKTNFEDYLRLVNLVRRDIYRNDTFLSAALLIKALYSWGGIVRTDRKTAMRFIKKTFARCISGFFRSWLIGSIWEYKDMMVRSMLMDGSKRELIGNIRGWKRRTVKDVMREYPTLTSVCLVDDPKEK